MYVSQILNNDFGFMKKNYENTKRDFCIIHFKGEIGDVTFV